MKRPAKCAGAHELADDNADAVLLDRYDRWQTRTGQSA